MGAWKDFEIGTSFDIANDKVWRDGRISRTTSRQTLCAKGDDMATIEIVVAGSLPEPHVERVLVPVGGLDRKIPGLLELGRESIEVPAGRFECHKVGAGPTPDGRYILESWFADEYPVPVMTVHRAGHVEVTSRLVRVNRGGA